METKKSHVFTRKLIALFLSVLMVLSCFTGALTAYANSTDDYHDDNLAANFLAWAETTDEQTCEALLDWVDGVLAGVNFHLQFSQNIVIDTISINGYIDSIDGIIDVAAQADPILDKYGGTVGGDIKNINLNPIAGGRDGCKLAAASTSENVVSQCGKSWRATNSAKSIIMAVAEALYINSNNYAGKNVLGQFLKGSFNVGSILGTVLKNLAGSDNIYGVLQGLLGMWDGYQSNLVYNVVANLIWQNTDWYTDEEVAAFMNDFKANGANQTSWNFDEQLFNKLSTKLLTKINVLVTYPNRVQKICLEEDNEDFAYGEIETDPKTGDIIYTNDSSAMRKYRIDQKMKGGMTYEAACNDLGYDSNLRYSTEKGFEGNILLFVYGDKNIDIAPTDTLFNFAFEALEFAWKTVLQDTLGLVHVNYNGHESVEGSVGSNYDNQFYYWMSDHKGWNRTDWKANYTEANVRAWADAVHEEYKCASADDFIKAVRLTYEYDRSVAKDAKNNWQDIDSTSLFNKLRYSPLADVYFDMQTGPINLYFEQTGYTEVSKFFETAFTDYSNMVAGFNDALVAAVADLFPESKNIGYGDGTTIEIDLKVPTLQKTGNTLNKSTVAQTLINNAAMMFEYAANTADANILNPFYVKKKISTFTQSNNLSEANFEEAMLPLLIACLNTPALDSLTGMIHDEKWDSCVDAEGVAIVALQEYLSYALPDKDYSVLWTNDADGNLVANAGENLFDDAIMIMARDALGYILSSIVPCRTKENKEWDVYTSDLKNDKTTIFDLLNSVICYYAGTDTYSDGGYTTNGKAVASLLGLVNNKGQCLVTKDNTIWENIDIIANKLFPAVGVLQYGDYAYAGKCSSYDLIYNDLINGFLNIGDTNERSGKMGLTTFIEDILTIVSAPPISQKGVDVMVYDDVVAPLFNAFFGARYEGQPYQTIMPYSSYYDSDSSNKTKSSSPWDSLVHVDTMAYYSSGRTENNYKEEGILGILIANIFEAFGGGTAGANAAAGGNGCWTGAMFAVEAVNNFLPSFVPQLSDHTLKPVTATFSTTSFSGKTAGSSFGETQLTIKNNSTGLNRFYRDANGNIQSRGRYFVKINSITCTPSNQNASALSFDNLAGKVIKPEEAVKLTVTGNAPSGDSSYTFTINYDIFEGKLNGKNLPAETTDNLKYSGLTSKAYLYISNSMGWRDALYGTGTSFQSTYLNTSAEASNSYVTNTAKGGTSTTLWNDWSSKPRLHAALPKDFIVPISDASSINDLQFSVYSQGTDKAFDGAFAYLESGVQFYKANNGVIDSTLTTSTEQKRVAYAAIDRLTGDVLNYERLDYFNPTTGKWDRGSYNNTTKGYVGYAAADLESLPETVTTAEGFQTRTHVVYTMDELTNTDAKAYFYGCQREAAGIDSNGQRTYVYTSILLDMNNADYVKAAIAHTDADGTAHPEAISPGTKTPGIYFAGVASKTTSNSWIHLNFLKYDGSTPLANDEYSMKVNVFTSNNNNMLGTVTMHICDDSSVETLKKTYQENLDKIASYRAQDFSDRQGNDQDGYTSATLKNVEDVLVSTLADVSRPITVENAGTVASKTIARAKTVSTTEELGDPAFAPLKTTEALPASVQIGATKGADGYWYYNEECTMPIYSNVALKDTDVKNGKDATGAAVTKVGNVWYLANAVQYEQVWDTTSYDKPYKADTTTQAVDALGAPLYREVSFVYRDAEGNKVTSTETKSDGSLKWVYKFAETETVTKPNDGTEYRSIFEQDVHLIEYTIEKMYEVVDKSIANRIVNEVSKARAGMVNVNYDVAAYEKMVQVAKEAEKLMWYEDDKTSPKIDETTGEVVKDKDGNIVYNQIALSNASSLEIDAAIKLYEDFRSYSDQKQRPYIGDRLEDEVKCATNVKGVTAYDYQSFDVTFETGTNEKGETVRTAATVTNASATEAKYGAYEDGVLVNKGDTKYTDASWNAYVLALAEAIDTADKKEKLISDTYTTKTALQVAENNLTEVENEPVADTITVSGKIMIAVDLEGNATTGGIGGINVLAGGEVVATSAADGTFTATVPVGTTELTVAGDTTIDRTVTLSGTANITDAIIPVVVCDYNHDTSFNSADVTLFYSGYNNKDNIYCDLNTDTSFNSADVTLFYFFNGKKVAYDALALD